jgi:hypothetical protein
VDTQVYRFSSSGACAGTFTVALTSNPQKTDNNLEQDYRFPNYGSLDVNPCLISRLHLTGLKMTTGPTLHL